MSDDVVHPVLALPASLPLFCDCGDGRSVIRYSHGKNRTCLDHRERKRSLGRHRRRSLSSFFFENSAGLFCSNAAHSYIDTHVGQEKYSFVIGPLDG